MQDHGLTQAEVDSLLARRPRSGRVTRTDQPHLAPREAGFLQPLAADEISALQRMYEPLGPVVSELLTQRLGTTARARLLGVDQLPAEQFPPELPGLHVIHVLRARPLEEPWLLALPLPMVHAILNRILGGGGDVGPVAPAPLSEIEARLLATITDPLADLLASAWSPWLELSTTIEGILATPWVSPFRQPQEPVARITWHVQWEGVADQIRLAIPSSSLRLAQRAGARGQGSEVEKVSGLFSSAFSSDRSSGDGPDKLPVIVCLEQSRLRLSEARQLAVGDLIATDQECHAPLAVFVDGRPRYLGLPAAFQGKKVVQIETVLGEE